jgi:hypothetical protein
MNYQKNNGACENVISERDGAASKQTHNHHAITSPIALHVYASRSLSLSSLEMAINFSNGTVNRLSQQRARNCQLT